MAAKRGDGGRAMLCERQGFEEIYCLFCVCISFLFERHKEGSLVILSYFIWKKERVGLIAFCLLSFGKGGIDLFSFCFMRTADFLEMIDRFLVLRYANAE